MQDTQIILTVVHTVILGFYLKPVLDLFLMRDKIVLRLQISVQKRVVLNLKKLSVGIGDIRPV